MKSLIAFLKAYKYKVGMTLCVISALYVLQAASSAVISSAYAGNEANIGVYALGFAATVALMILFIYFKYKDTKRTK